MPDRRGMVRAARGVALVHALVTVILATAMPALAQQVAREPRHFIYLGRDRERILEPTFATERGIAGAQLRYTWKELEPARDRYEFGAILEDVARLDRQGKRLFIQLQDVSFGDAVPVPDYLRTDPEFGGGADRKLETDDRDTSRVRFGGWVARRWDPRVRARFAKLLDTLGRAVDGRIEGINFAETAIGFENPRFHPSGFTFDAYASGIMATMDAARRAFVRSHVIQYANFMPGDWPLSADGPRYLRAIHAHAESIGVGVGGPDLLPHRWAQRRHSLPLIAARSRGVVAGIAVQDGNLADRNPSTGAPVTVEELYRFAVERLRVDYIFWGTEEPYYSTAVLPFLRARGETRAASP